jgi:hypothetical protein
MLQESCLSTPVGCMRGLGGSPGYGQACRRALARPTMVSSGITS